MNLLFEFSSDPFTDDLSAQYARMALAVSMENRVTLLYRNNAVVLALDPCQVPIAEVDYYNQERFLLEQEVDMYLLADDMNPAPGRMKDGVKVISRADLDSIYEQQDVIFRH